MVKAIASFLFALSVSSGLFAAPQKAATPSRFVPHQILIKFKDSASYAASAARLQIRGTVLKKFAISQVELWKVPEDRSVPELIQALSKLPDVAFAEPNYIYSISEIIPNDPEFSKQYSMNNSGEGGGVRDADIDAPEAWEVTQGSRKVLVGIIDTGMDFNHPDLRNNYWHNPGETGLDSQGRDKRSNNIDDDGNGYVDDYQGWDFVNGDNEPLDDHGHGTHCAGTIGAEGQNGLGIAGINWQVSMVALKVFDASGNSEADKIIEAIEYATRIGVKVTNNSWGGSDDSRALRDAILGAQNKNILFVAAAGNVPIDIDKKPYFPAAYPFGNIITVAATDHSDRIAEFSSFGVESVDLGAPGVDILSTLPGQRYWTMSGTSMAAPNVTGAVALMLARYPDMDASTIKRRLILSADPVPDLYGKVASSGRLNLAALIQDDTVPPASPKDIRVEKVSMESIILSWNRSGDDGDQGFAREYQVRKAKAPIVSEQDWQNATPVKFVFQTNPFISNRVQIECKEGLELNETGYFAVRAIDKANLISEISSSISFAMQPSMVIFANDGSSISGFSAEGTWGIEEADGRTILSDSPRGDYQNNTNASLTIDKDFSPRRGTSYYLKFATKYQFESYIDFGFIEYSLDGSPVWHELDRVTSQSDWTTKVYEIKLRLAHSIRLRFRILTNETNRRQGWWIDDVKVYQAAPM